MRQSIRGYTDAVIEQTADTGDLAAAADRAWPGSWPWSTAPRTCGGSSPTRAYRSLLAGRWSPTCCRIGSTPPTLRLVVYALEADRATEFRDDLAWLAARIDAAAQDLTPVGDVVLGRTGRGRAGRRLRRRRPRAGRRTGGTLDDIEDELFRFMRIVDGSEELSAALTDRDVPAGHAPVAGRRTCCRARPRPATVRLAAYATQVGRPRDYEELLAHLVDRVAAESNRRLAEVRVPVDLDEDRRQHLAAALSRVAGHPVEVRVTVDPAVLGGFVATMGDTVVDGSTRHRLELLKERLATPEAEITIGDPS